MSDIFALSDRAVDQIVALDPVAATFAGIAGYDHAWPDLSPEGNEERRRTLQGLKSEAEACPAPDDRASLARQVLLDEVSMGLRLLDEGHQFVDLNNLASPVQHLRDVFDLQATETPDDWRAIIERLSSIDAPLDGYRRTLSEGLSQQRLVARRQVESVIEQLATMAGDNSPFDGLRARLTQATASSSDGAGSPDGAGSSDGAAATDWSGLETDLDAAVNSAKEASERMGRFLANEYLPHAAAEDPVGVDRYRLAARTFLGTELDVDETYAWGWDEVCRLTDRANELCSVIAPGRSLGDTLDMLTTDPAYGVETAAEFVAVMTERQLQALDQLSGTHFEVPEPIRAIEVKMSPPGGAAGAYYTPPSEDFTRPGTVWYSPTGRDRFPLYDEITTAYHEGFPGHHLQVGLQAILAEELSRYHRLLVWYSGSGEGWALYAEHLMGELGYFERPEYELGLVISQLFRSCRIVIDIGTHCRLPITGAWPEHAGEPWTFDRAVALLQERTGFSDEMIRSEVTRYYGWPGQAISYKVGEKAILDLRESLSARPGFDLKAFHTDLLSIGSVGLDLINERMLA